MHGDFDHQRLDVYQTGRKFAIWRRGIGRRLPSGNGDLMDQLNRASTSILLNIAEGCGEFSIPDRIRFYRTARRSAAECAAVLDIFEDFELIPAPALEDGRALLSRVIAMLTAMSRRPETQARSRGSAVPEGRIRPSR